MTRPPEMRLYLDAGEIVVDSFAGGGGASKGIELALGRGPDIAINHDAEAIALHRANHPESEHHCEDVWAVDPVKACRGRPVGLMWLSPDCKHFSKAKGGKPVSKKVRGLAWVAVRWAKAVQPRIIVLENVEEFQTWGPVSRETNRPDPLRKGLTFKRFVGRLRNLGYVVEWRELRACDFGAPTIRKRLFLIGRRDGQPIVWPTPTHGKGRALAIDRERDRARYPRRRREVLAHYKARQAIPTIREHRRQYMHAYRASHPRDGLDRAYQRAYMQQRRADPVYRAKQNARKRELRAQARAA